MVGLLTIVFMFLIFLYSLVLSYIGLGRYPTRHKFVKWIPAALVNLLAIVAIITSSLRLVEKFSPEIWASFLLGLFLLACSTLAYRITVKTV